MNNPILGKKAMGIGINLVLLGCLIGSTNKNLIKLDKKYKIVLVDPIRHPKSTRFMPMPIDFFPKMGLFKRGYFKKELSQTNIINQTIDII